MATERQFKTDEVITQDIHQQEVQKEIQKQTPSEVMVRDIQPQQQKTSLGLFVLFSYLYFIQGAISGLIKTVPYVYPTLPDVDIMIIFHSISFPYSFKFIIAPFLQKYTNISYGKRKTWIIISELITSILLLCGSFYTQLQNARIFAIICFFIEICIVIQNIALHALIVKEITSAHQSGLIQSYAQTVGALVGSLVLLKLTSKQFAESIGLLHQITSTRIVLIYLAVIILIPLFFIHFKLKQKVLQSQVRGSSLSITQILKYCDVFITPNSQYFRFCVFMFVYQQGLNFFLSLYDYQLLNAGFSRNASNTIGNLVIVPVTFLTFYYKSWTNKVKGHKNSIMISTSVVILVCLYIWIVFPLDIPSQFTLIFILAIFQFWKAYSFTVMMNQFPLHALTGIYLTFIGSFYNFGNLRFIHGKMCKWFGWRLMSMIGLILQIFIVLGTTRFHKWVKRGHLQIPKEIEQNEQKKEEYKQMQ